MDDKIIDVAPNNVGTGPAGQRWREARYGHVTVVVTRAPRDGHVLLTAIDCEAGSTRVRVVSCGALRPECATRSCWKHSLRGALGDGGWKNTVNTVSALLTSLCGYRARGVSFIVRVSVLPVYLSVILSPCLCLSIPPPKKHAVV